MAIIKFQTLTTERLILRKFKSADANKFFEYRTNPLVAKYQSEGWSDYKFEQAVAFVEKQMQSEPGIMDTWFQIAIELKTNGRLIGDLGVQALGVHALKDTVNQVEIGFSLDPEYQNKGYAYEAARRLFIYLFEDLGMHRIVAMTDARNNASISLLERLGMRKEGHFIKHEWYKGEYIDTMAYAILYDEWKKD